MRDESQRQREFEAALTEDAYQRAWRYALYQCSGYHDAQDLLQDSLAQAYLKFGQLRDSSLFLAWLLRIVRSQYLMRLRRGRRDDARDTRAGQAGSASPSTNAPEARLELAGLPPELVAGLLRLPAIQREVIELFYLHELDAAEVARVLGISRANVKVRLLRGREALRRELAMEPRGVGRSVEESHE